MSATGKDDGTGLVGLGPSHGSNIREVIGSSAGNGVLDRIFLSNTSTPNYLTTLLGRSDDPTDLYPGNITIGELVSGFENVTNMPKLPVAEVSIREHGDQHWQVLLDKNGIIGPDGKHINTTSIVDGGHRLNAVLDTGFSLSQVPRQVADVIYGRIPNATFGTVGRGVGDAWVFPCNIEINVTVLIGGVKYPIHPLDTSLEIDGDGTTSCVGSVGVLLSSCAPPDRSCLQFQPKVVQNDNYDMILGMAFREPTFPLSTTQPTDLRFPQSETPTCS